jgi:hypothetical protein
VICNSVIEVEVQRFLASDTQLLATGLDCSNGPCGGKQCMGLSFYVENNLASVVAKIRAYRDVPPLSIFCVLPPGEHELPTRIEM